MISSIYIFFSLSEVTLFMFKQQRPTNKLIKLYNHNDLDNHFESFCLKYYNQNCILQNPDYEFRKQIFNKTMARINKLNTMYNNGYISFVSDFNQFSALTLDELKMYLGGSNINRSNNNLNIISNNNKSIPKSIDWRLKNNNILNGIKNQANCSSSWIFSAISNIESMISIATNKQIILSEQNILDCYHMNNNNNNTDNCQINNNNVQLNDVFNYLVTNPIDLGGLTYPYLGKDSHTCNYNESNGSGVKVTNIVELKPGEINLLNALALNGPISVNYEVFSDYFHYKSGVYVKLNDTILIGMHSAILVGYGVKDNKLDLDLDYFILKNAWSHWWGMDGFGLIGRNIKGLNESKGMCNIATQASYPLLDLSQIKLNNNNNKSNNYT